MFSKRMYFLFITLLFSEFLFSQGAIRVNQIGFYPTGPKFAVAIGTTSDVFHLTTVDQTDTVFTSSLDASRTWQHSGETVKLIDFSDFTGVGEYIIRIDDIGQSHPFSIKENVHQEVSRGVIKGYYFQRASSSITPVHGDAWTRAAGHPDTQVRIHASAATDERPENTIISAPKGWYDAGDYNKYIVNSGISTYTILAAYEHYPEYYRNFDLRIPESGNNIPDILDEALWNLYWMLAMQDPNDGGVYHKLTTANFSGAVMPHQATATRYVVQKGTAATLDFAAVMAQASRIFREFETELPGLADSCLSAAISAWNWARRNPNIRYDQGALNAMYNPDINTGAYGDGNFSDEFQWAAAELFITTKADSFLAASNPLAGPFGVPWWGGVNTLGLYSLVHHRSQLSSGDSITAVTSLLGVANWLRDEVNTSAYHIVMGKSGGDFVWGSNSVASNQGMLLIQAFNVTGDSTYLEAALQNLDYLLGRNATGFSFVTGFGSKPPLHPHHRQSEADTVVDPVPGLLAGGPNPGRQDGCSGYIGNEPARSYVDDWCSYASNEIAINWNAPIVYLAGAIEAAYSPDSPTGILDQINNPFPEKFGLQQNYPNPFNPETTITYLLPKSGNVHLAVYNITGQLIRTLQNEILSPGQYAITWDGITNTGAIVTSGIYIARLQFSSNSQTFIDAMKMTVLQ